MSTVQEVIYQLKQPIREDRLIKITDAYNNPEFNDIQLPSREIFEECVSYLECDPNNIYYDKNALISPFCYVEKYVFIDFPNLYAEQLQFLHVKERVKGYIERTKESLEKKEYNMIFFFLDDRCKFYMFLKYFEEIPDNQKHTVFSDIYTKLDYGFQLLTSEFITEICNYQTDKYKKELKRKISPFIGPDGYIRIFRGQGEKSMSHTKSFSWSTNLDTAYKFASKHKGNGKLYESKVKPEHVLDFFVDRNENEVITLPQHLIDVKQTDVYYRSDFGYDFNKLYNKTKKRISLSLFHNPKGVHGVKHCQRVLYHAMALSDLLYLSDKEKNILVEFAIYHDIGRIHDDEDESHGIEGFKKLNSSILCYTNRDMSETIRYLIDNHCIKDNIAYANVNNYDIDDKERAVFLLKIAKDADGLDRVRLGDLDTTYLRNDISLYLVSLAYELLFYSKREVKNA